MDESGDKKSCQTDFEQTGNSPRELAPTLEVSMSISPQLPEENGSSESEPEANDALFGGVSRSLKIIRKQTRTALSECQTEESREEMTTMLRNTTIGLIKNECCLMETAKIVAGIVDEVVPESSEDEEDDGTFVIEKSMKKGIIPKPFSFSPNEAMNRTIQNMSDMFEDRMQKYKDSLTDDSIRDHPKYQALQKQINLAESDLGKAKYEGNGDEEEYSSEEDDNFYLPSIDPITKEPMMNPVQIKHCNHLFERNSIMSFITSNPNSRCPLNGCTNESIISFEDLKSDYDLTMRVRQKNRDLASKANA